MPPGGREADGRDPAESGAARPDGRDPGERDAAQLGERDAVQPGGLRLDDALKLAGIAATGGMAKRLIQAGEVLVNGRLETRRKRLLRAGDVIDVAGETFEIDLEAS
jgi:ribosome-associated protein